MMVTRTIAAIADTARIVQKLLQARYYEKVIEDVSCLLAVAITNSHPGTGGGDAGTSQW